MLKLSVLDQSVAPAGTPEDRAIRTTIALAKRCEELGYHRFWVSEHHDHPAIVGSAPEILMAAIAGSTNRIRVGSAGVMLPHYAPLKVAEQFRILEAIAPGRIDLGLGRAPGSDGRTARALNPNATADSENFPANVRDLMAWVSGAPLVEGHPHAGIGAHPRSDTTPEVWMLGTSNYGAELAAYLGIPYCFAHFITDGHGVDWALDLYRAKYQPSERHPAPRAAVCVWALAAETEAGAERLFLPRAHYKMMRFRGRMGALQSPDALASFDYTDKDREILAELRAEALIGTGEQVVGKLRGFADQHGVDEMVVLTWAFDPADQLRSYELLAEAGGLAGGGQG